MKTKLLTAIALTFSLPLAAQPRDTKVVILLETGEAVPIQCDAYSRGTLQCLEISKAKSDELRSAVNVEMRFDPYCAGMAFANSFSDVGSFGKDNDYINATVGYYPTTSQNGWWLNIVRINGKLGPDYYMSGSAATPKEIAHKLCYIIHQEKMTRR